MASSREVQVGVLVVAALAVLASAVFMIGQQDLLFSRKARYSIRFASVSGLVEGSMVQLNGVTVGSVQEVVLPQDMGQNEITVRIAIDKRHAQRIREDSAARIKTMGLIGDKYVALTSGSPEFPQIPPGGEIPTAEQTSVDQLIASGEDVMHNVVSISHSLAAVLERMERGEGLLGELTVRSAEGDELRRSLVASLDSVEKLARDVERGRGPLGRLIHDEALAERLASAVTRLDATLAQAQDGEGLLPHLLADAETRQRFDRALTDLGTASRDLAALAGDLRRGEGLLPRLLNDADYGRQVSAELEQLVARLNRVASALEDGEGTAARLIHDPEIYDAIQDVIIGINESQLLRWLIRNRQKAGIEKRYEEERRRQAVEPDPGDGG
jgi:phospholipid/cholesterol/gamma-HCH transport system substrate-binding protein